MPEALIPPEVCFAPGFAEIFEQIKVDNPPLYEDLFVPLANDEDDPLFGVRRIDSLSTLEIQPTTQQWSICRECYDVHPTYSYSITNKQDTIRYWSVSEHATRELEGGYIRYTSVGGYCSICILRRVTGIHMYNYDSSLHAHDFSLRKFIIPEIFPTPTISLDMCEACDKGMIPNDRNYGEVIAKGNDGLEHKVHVKCSSVCRCCNERYVHNGIFAVDFNDLDGNRTCIECFDPNDTEHDRCESCMGHVTYDTIYSDIRGDYRCRPCYEEWIECSDCGYEYGEDEGHYCEESDNNCSPYIHGYSYKPSPVFFGDDRIYMGIELEVEANQRRSNLPEGAEFVATFADHSKRLYLKTDGSISYGFEIVTHPHSLKEYHSLDWSWLDKLRIMGYRSWDAGSCGIHVHVGLTAFVNQNHEIRFTKFIYDNERQVKRIAGRASSYASFGDKGHIIPKIKNKRQSNNRYSAVNVENDHTLEVRVFKGSLRKERVLSAIEFVHAVTEYTRSLEIVPKIKPFSWARFVSYVTVNADIYPNLFIIINETFDNDNTPNDREDD